MNRCILVGRLTRDPEVSFSEKAQMSVAKFTVAVDRISKKDGEPEADFFNCVAFDRKAEFVEQYWYSGMRVAVCGRLQNENYTNKKGEKIYSVSLKADDVEFADGKREVDTGQVQNADVPGNVAPASHAAAPASRSVAPASHAAAPTSRTAAPSRSAAPAVSQRTSQPVTGRNAQRSAPARSAAGRTAAQRTAKSVASDGFMNVASGIEENLPFN